MNNYEIAYGLGKNPSFELDHVRANERVPFVRVAEEIRHEVNGAEIVLRKYDIRLTGMNDGSAFKVQTAHTLEHLLSGLFRKEFGSSYIDLSPMGCMTGFYLTVFHSDAITPEKICRFLAGAVDAIASIDEVPGASIRTCGAYLSHDLNAAKELASRVFPKLKPYTS